MWQTGGRIGREELANSIAECEDILESHLNFHLAPKWTTHLESFPHQGPGYWYNTVGPLQVDRGYLIEMGVQAKGSVALGADITWADPDGDGYFETGTVTGVTSVTDPSELVVYYPGVGGDDAWEIRPIKVTLNGAGGFVITFNRELCVIPEELEGYKVRAVEGSTTGNFLSEVDVFRKYTDPSVQGRYVWAPGDWCNVCGGNCKYSEQSACVIIREPRLGFLTSTPADWDTTELAFSTTKFDTCRWPDRIRFWVRSGWRNMTLPYPNIQMDPMWTRILTHFVLARIGRPLCGCDATEHESRYWAEDLSLVVGDSAVSRSFRTRAALLDNPLGPQRGAIQAWQFIERFKLGDRPVLG